VSEVLHEISSPMLGLNCGVIVVALSLVSITCFEGSRLTAEAEATMENVSRLMGNRDMSQTQKNSFVYLVTQMRLRNINVRNFLFNINWKTFLTVSWREV
jgi:hypothetical protein